ncbi:MAG: membrane protein [Actinomycetota bacterium]
MLTQLMAQLMAQADRLLARMSSVTPFTSVYGLARSVMAISSALTLIVNDSIVLRQTSLPSPNLACSGLSKIGAYCAIAHHPEIVRGLLIIILLITASGWRPRLTGVLHWWASFSIFAGIIAHEGGDQVAAVLTLLLVPITLTDSRRSHWTTNSGNSPVRNIAARCWFVCVRGQVALIYLASVIAKLRVAEWRRGTALLYYTQPSSFRASAWMHWLTGSPLLVRLLTWGTLAIELALAFSLIASPKMRVRILLPLGISFHVLAAAAFQIPSFSLIMIGALILLLVPLDTTLRGSRSIDVGNDLRSTATRSLSHTFH